MLVNFKIAAACVISLSEIQKVRPEIDDKYIENNKEEIQQMLYDLGIDNHEYPAEEQLVLHRNRFNEIVYCLRWSGMERTDNEWLNSGYASNEALDKAEDNKLLNDLYRKKGLIEYASN